MNAEQELMKSIMAGMTRLKDLRTSVKAGGVMLEVGGAYLFTFTNYMLPRTDAFEDLSRVIAIGEVHERTVVALLTLATSRPENRPSSIYISIPGSNMSWIDRFPYYAVWLDRISGVNRISGVKAVHLDEFPLYVGMAWKSEEFGRMLRKGV